MRPALALCVLCAVLAVARAGEGDGKKPAAAPAETVPAVADVDRAVARAVKWLAAEQDADGGFGTTAGETGLALWALRHSGMAKDDRVALRAAARLDRDVPDGTTYSTSLGICGLLAHDAVKHRDRIQKGLDALAKGQCENGQWSYVCKAGGKSGGDNSNTQCAVLALAAARLRGFTVADAPLRAFRDYAVRTQNEDGGWGYSERQHRESYGAMTAGMLMGRALCDALLAGKDPRKEASLTGKDADRAVARLAAQWAAWLDAGDVAPGAPSGREFGEDAWYSLWSVERAGVLCTFEKLGDREWYAPGAKRLLAWQDEGGSWRGSRAIAATSWALLFLRRGSAAVVTPGEGEVAPVTGGK